MNAISRAQSVKSTASFWHRQALIWHGLVLGFSLVAAGPLIGAPPEFADISQLLAPVTNRAPIPSPATLVVRTNGLNPVATGTNATTRIDPVSPVATATNATPASTLNNMEALDDKYQLAIGDRLSFRILEDEEEPKPLFVTDSGDLEMPHIGRFPALGKTCRQLARELRAEYEKEYYYQATVIVAVDLMTKSRGKVYLIGPVRMPGPQEIPSDEVLTLSKAILRAGGFNDFADKQKVKVTRRGSLSSKEDQTFVVNVAEVLEKGKTDSDLPLQPGDFIYVPERLIRF